MFINLKSQTDFSGFYIVFDGSTNIEKEGTRGVSHLVEHLICKTFQDLRDDFQRNGIDWNASTTNNVLAFYFTGLESNLKKFRNKLVDRIFDFDITKKDFESERKIILQEYTETFNNSNKVHLLNAYRKYLNSFAPIGSKDDLEKLKFIDLLNFYQEYYDKPTKIINVSKNYKFTSNLIDFNEKKIEKEWTRGEYNNKLEKPGNGNNKKSIILLSDLVGEEVNKMKLLSRVLGQGLESPLYKELREKNELCYSIRCDIDRFNNKGLFKIKLSTDKTGEEKAIKLLKNIIKSPQKYITQERVDIIKNNLKIEQQKDEINRYTNVQEHLNPGKFSIYYNLNKISRKDLIDYQLDKLKLESLIIDSL